MFQVAHRESSCHQHWPLHLASRRYLKNISLRLQRQEPPCFGTSGLGKRQECLAGHVLARTLASFAAVAHMSKLSEERAQRLPVPRPFGTLKVMWGPYQLE